MMMKEFRFLVKQHELCFWEIPSKGALINNSYGAFFICNSSGNNCIGRTNIMLSGFKT